MRHFLLLLIKYFASLIEILLGIRLVLKFLGASERAIAVDLLYRLTDIIIFPFQFIFPVIYSKWGIVDIVAVSAMIGYFILALVILSFVNFIFNWRGKEAPER